VQARRGSNGTWDSQLLYIMKERSETFWKYSIAGWLSKQKKKEFRLLAKENKFYQSLHKYL
jgi:phage-related protein